MTSFLGHTRKNSGDMVTMKDIYFMSNEGVGWTLIQSH